MRERHVTRVSLHDLKSLKGKTDWKRLDAMSEADIERAAADDPDAHMTTEEFWKNAKLVWPGKKEPVTIRIDKDILEWFRKRGRGYQSKINTVLRTFVQAQKHPRKATKRAAVKN